MLAKLFRVIKLAENAGFGFDKMMRGWKETGAEPLVETGIDYFKISFPLSGVKGGVKLTPKQEYLLKMIISDPYLSFEKAAEIMKINVSAVRKHFDKLKEKEIIVRMGPAKGGYWEVIEE